MASMPMRAIGRQDVCYKCDKSSLDVAPFNDQSFIKTLYRKNSKNNVDLGQRYYRENKLGQCLRRLCCQSSIKKNERAFRMNGDQLCSGHFLDLTVIMFGPNLYVQKQDHDIAHDF